MNYESFELIVREAYNNLPEHILSKIENVEIIIQDNPDYTLNYSGSQGNLLGLYTGVPLTHRNTGYGMYPITPDRIYIFKNNIEAICTNDNQLVAKIFEVLYHEIGHYFGMNETEIRDSMKHFQLRKFIN
jgi:predicted Zn-dependent protease with MMP-like domain